jgi:hypothetical protein
MKQQDVDTILSSGKNVLMQLVPVSNYKNRPLNHGDYHDTGIFKKNFLWYKVVIGLNGKLSDSKKRAAKMDFDYDLDLLYIAEKWIDQKGCCAVTKMPLSFETGTLWDKNPTACSIDRIYNSSGYIEGNVRLVTHWANNAKSTWDDNLFEEMIRSTYKQLEPV